MTTIRKTVRKFTCDAKTRRPPNVRAAKTTADAGGQRIPHSMIMGSNLQSWNRGSKSDPRDINEIHATFWQRKT